ncbi:hypothetical protein ACU4GD_29355 [Cupriavidus basilensis]
MIVGVDAAVTSLAARIVMDTRGHRASVPESELVLDLGSLAVWRRHRRTSTPGPPLCSRKTVRCWLIAPAWTAMPCSCCLHAARDRFPVRSGAARQLFLTPAFADCGAGTRQYRRAWLREAGA